MSRDFRVTIHEPKRRFLWQQWIGTDTVCVRTPIRQRVHLEGRGDTDVYILDEASLTPEQRQAVCRGIAEVFGTTAEEVEQSLTTPGIPIMAEDCSISVLNPGRWLL